MSFHHGKLHEDARNVFDEIPVTNLLSWNTVLAVYTTSNDNSMRKRIWGVVWWMQEEGLKMDAGETIYLSISQFFFSDFIHVCFTLFYGSFDFRLFSFGYDLLNIRVLVGCCKRERYYLIGWKSGQMFSCCQEMDNQVTPIFRKIWFLVY